MHSIVKEVTSIEKKKKKIEKKLQFIDSTRFMTSSLFNLFDNLSEVIHLNVNTDTTIKDVKLPELNRNVATLFLNTESLKTI